jgi:hypothetical protein
MKGGGEQTTTQKLDPATERYRNEIFDRARGVSNEGYAPFRGQTVAGANANSGAAMAGASQMPGVFGQVLKQFGGQGGPNTQPYQQAGATGAAALGGDQAATNQLMNPYQRNVIDAMGGEYDRMRSKATMGGNDQATQGGAFGGSRHALMQGERLGAIDRAQGSEIANLLHGGFNDAMGRAGQAANLGLGATGQQGQYQLGAGGLQLGAAQGQQNAYGQQFGMGDYFRGIDQQRLNENRNQFNEQRDWGARGLDILKGGMTGMPYGQTTSQPLQRNAFSGAAGGAMTGMALGGPIGAGIGGLGGLLFG